MDEYNCEILIIGAGPAGLSAGLYCGRAGRNTIILDGKEPSALTRAKEIWNYPGVGKIEGPKLLHKFKVQLNDYKNVKIIPGDVISLMIGMGQNMISTRTANITSDAVIIATGGGQREEIIKGEEALIGYGVSYCALCDGPLYKDRIVYLYGSDEEVLEDALILKQMGCNAKLISNVGIDNLPKKIEELKRNEIEIFDKCEIIEIKGNDQGLIDKITCKSTDPSQANETRVHDLDCLFILSHVPSNTIFKKAGIELDEKGNIIINKEQQTNIKSVYAAGDVTGGIFQVIFAAGEGARAGIIANKFVRELKKD